MEGEEASTKLINPNDRSPNLISSGMRKVGRGNLPVVFHPETIDVVGGWEEGWFARRKLLGGEDEMILLGTRRWKDVASIVAAAL